jgi:2-polyprenyl-3-methyl-5-hydroxy-6-metoxy-1,4-benzoquinol methylase
LGRRVKQLSVLFSFGGRALSQNPGRLLDKTHLSIDQAEERGFVHRDYIAHCFRWSHVVKYLMRQHRYKDAHIIDIGCGKDQPLPRLLYANKMTGFDYTGIDVNSMSFHPTLVTAHNNGKMRVSMHDETDASLLEPEDLIYGKGDYGVCFECLEHMQPYIAYRMLQKWKQLFKDRAVIFVSTPVFNGSAAGNHINEMGRKTLGAAFEAHGFTILGCYGTFASQSEIYPYLTGEERLVIEGLSEYYDSNVLSTILAPLHPEGSRNNLWVIGNYATPDRTFWEMGKAVYDRCQNPDIEELFVGRLLSEPV